MAAWRSGGISALPFKSALPAAVAPNRALAARRFRECCGGHFHNIFGQHFLFETVTFTSPLNFRAVLTFRGGYFFRCIVRLHNFSFSMTRLFSI
jgi:hypothetical protein